MRKAAILLTLLARSAVAEAQAPSFIPVQAFLTDDAGAPLAGTYEVRLRLYAAPIAGTALFDETHSASVEAGLVTLLLGSQGAMDLTLFRDVSAVYLGITIGTDPEMSPRIAVGSVPYAAYADHAGDARTLGGHAAADFRLATDPDADALGALACATGDVPVRSGADWVCAPGASLGTPLSEAEVDAYVANNGYLTASSANPLYVNEGQADSVTSAMVAPDTLTAADIGADAVGTSEIADGAILDADVGASANIARTKIAGTAIVSSGPPSQSVAGNLQASGVLSAASLQWATPQTFTLVLPASQFSLRPADFAPGVMKLSSFGGHWYPTSDEASQLVAPVALPDGADITQVDCFYYDNDATEAPSPQPAGTASSNNNWLTVAFTLQSRRHTSANVYNLASAVAPSTTGASASVPTFSRTTVSGTGDPVSSADFAYWLRVNLDPVNCTFVAPATSCTPTNSESLGFFGCRITYQLTALRF